MRGTKKLGVSALYRGNATWLAPQQLVIRKTWACPSRRYRSQRSCWHCKRPPQCRFSGL